ncbi:MerR family transcriptional regulator [Nocardia yamanashiensis]|uniref:MerR family transcriptional regulator n=1 Tax=Nocardia yamanashiensis TaxID=209247 RepID=UPI00082D8756|nr:MerR family transcriptional regulator [Nocardia yamanashiensis]
MAWSITQVARMAGITSRTLRHYDEIGLLKPAWIGSNGYRHYEIEQLLRLQQILVLRRLDLSLDEIAEVLAAQRDPLDALRDHHKRLRVQAESLAAVTRTVERTIAELEGNSDMTKISRPENLFEGFDHTQYDDEARERWPEEFEQSQAYWATLTPADIERMQREVTAAMVRMAELMVANVDVGDPAVQAEIDQHYKAIATGWKPTREAYTCMGQMYVDDERFKANYDRIAEGLAEYYRDAMAIYADAHLS